MTAGDSIGATRVAIRQQDIDIYMDSVDKGREDYSTVLICRHLTAIMDLIGDLITEQAKIDYEPEQDL